MLPLSSISGIFSVTVFLDIEYPFEFFKSHLVIKWKSKINHLLLLLYFQFSSLRKFSFDSFMHLNVLIIVTLKLSNIWISCASLPVNYFSSQIFVTPRSPVRLVVLYTGHYRWKLLEVIGATIGFLLPERAYLCCQQAATLAQVASCSRSGSWSSRVSPGGPVCSRLTGPGGGGVGLSGPTWKLGLPSLSSAKSLSHQISFPPLCKTKLYSACLTSTLKLSSSFSGRYPQEGLSGKS